MQKTSKSKAIDKRYLIAKGVASDDDGLGPSRDDLRNALEENRLPEDGSVENVTDGAVGGPVHLRKVELLDALLIGCNGRTLDSHVILEDCLRSIDCHLVLGLALKSNNIRERIHRESNKVW